ncbi:MAG: DUF2182 domain-containing protein, partial [Burkholderiaceae bacterium]
MGFLLTEWRPGRRGAWHMGIRHGMLCLGCCWALMSLLLVLGAMNPIWIVALTGVVTIEKLAPPNDRVIRDGIGWVLLAGALIVGGPAFVA